MFLHLEYCRGELVGCWLEGARPSSCAVALRRSASIWIVLAGVTFQIGVQQMSRDIQSNWKVNVKLGLAGLSGRLVRLWVRFQGVSVKQRAEEELVVGSRVNTREGSFVCMGG